MWWSCGDYLGRSERPHMAAMLLNEDHWYINHNQGIWVSSLAWQLDYNNNMYHSHQITKFNPVVVHKGWSTGIHDFGFKLFMFLNCICAMWLEICDWDSENGPSGRTEFDHIFHICCIITNNLLWLYKWS